MKKKLIVVGVALVAVVLLPTMVLAQSPFTDVPAGFVHEPGINYVATNGITQGCTPTQYCPNDNLTRGQMATFLYRASGNDPATPPSVNADTIDGLDSTELMGGGGTPGPEGPPGPAGPEGPAGPAGPAGVANREQVQANVAVAAATGIGDFELLCPTGKSLLGGGAAATSTDYVLVQSAPSSLPAQGWVGQVRRVAGNGGTTLVVYAICANVG